MIRDGVLNLANGFVDHLLARQPTDMRDKSFAAIGDLINARTFDEETGIYSCVAGPALFMEVLPVVGIDEVGLGAFQALVKDLHLGKDGLFTVINWSSGRIGPELRNWERARPDDRVIRDARRDVFTKAARGELFSVQNIL